MDLTEIESVFNQYYNFLDLKMKAYHFLVELIQNSQNNFLKEVEDKLTGGMSLSNFRIEYRNTSLIINDSDLCQSIFRIRFDLINSRTNFQAFWYDVEYSSKGEVVDDYFGEY